jgi:glycosyltransferase involved in cell wall biosynthesis
MSAVSLVSVIIPCYNHGRYLARAIDSVLSQPYSSVEIIVIDDGSVDNTREVAEGYPSVKYHFQPNQGLSAARNTGIEHSEGNFLIFLDADDWLLKNAIAINAAYLEHDKSLGFVSGAFVISRNGVEQEVKKPVNSEHYLRLLQGNYISMHATVMYTRKVFKTLRFDPSLKACEDYDVYLRVTRDFPVLHHTHLLAAYFHHDTNMSSDYSLMLEFSTRVLRSQEPFLRSAPEKIAMQKGLQYWTRHYAEVMYAGLVNKVTPLNADLRKKFLRSLRQNSPKHFLKYIFLLPLMPFRSSVASKPALA